MPRFIALVSATVLATASCNSHPAQGTAGSAGSGGSSGPGSAASAAGSGSQAPAAPRPASVIEQVQLSAPAGTHVAPAELTVPGLELFALTDGKPAADDEIASARLVGVAGGVGGKVLERRELVRAAIEAKADPRTLARVALWAAQDDSEVLDAAKSREHKAARVAAPAIARGALVFWIWTNDLPRMVEKARLDLTTGALAIEPPKVLRATLISNAMTTLGSVNVQRHAAAIKVLAAVCTEPRARHALLSVLGNHPRLKTRVAVADEIHRCGPPVVDALVTAMEQDRSAQLRTQVAAALGRIGDPRARPALAKAARGEDANLAWTAGNALKKIQ